MPSSTTKINCVRIDTSFSESQARTIIAAGLSSEAGKRKLNVYIDVLTMFLYNQYNLILHRRRKKKITKVNSPQELEKLVRYI